MTEMSPEEAALMMAGIVCFAIFGMAFIVGAILYILMLLFGD